MSGFDFISFFFNISYLIKFSQLPLSLFVGLAVSVNDGLVAFTFTFALVSLIRFAKPWCSPPRTHHLPLAVCMPSERETDRQTDRDKDLLIIRIS